MPGAYIWGWDYDAGDWVKCRVDDAGKLIIGSGTIEVEQDTPADLQATVTPASGAEFLNYPRIPDGATQVVFSGSITHDTLAVHTVSDDVTFYLSFVCLSDNNASGGFGTFELRVTDASDNFKYDIIAGQRPDGSSHSTPLSFLPPLEIPTGWKIKLTSPVAAFPVHVFIHGYEL